MMNRMIISIDIEHEIGINEIELITVISSSRMIVELIQKSN